MHSLADSIFGQKRGCPFFPIVLLCWTFGGLNEEVLLFNRKLELSAGLKPAFFVTNVKQINRIDLLRFFAFNFADEVHAVVNCAFSNSPHC